MLLTSDTASAGLTFRPSGLLDHMPPPEARGAPARRTSPRRDVRNCSGRERQRGHSLQHETGGMSVTWQRDLRVEAPASRAATESYVSSARGWRGLVSDCANTLDEATEDSRSVNNLACKR